MSETLDVAGAADYLKMSVDGVKRKARAGKISGTKVGRKWVFLKDDLAADIRRGYSCRYTNQKARQNITLVSPLAAKKLDDRVAQLTGDRPKRMREN